MPSFSVGSKLKSAPRIDYHLGVPMQITIRTFTGKVFSLDVEPKWSIYSIKLLISRTLEIPADRLRLFLNGKQLKDDGQSLGACDAQADSTIHVYIYVPTDETNE